MHVKTDRHVSIVSGQGKRTLRLSYSVPALLLIFSFLLFLSPVAGTQVLADETISETRDVFAMDTYMTMTAYGEHAAEALTLAEDEIHRLDDLLSTGKDDSEISQLNQNGNAVFEEAASYLMARSLEVNQLTEGAFNPMIYPFMEAWGFTNGNFRVPEQQEIENMLPLLDLSKVNYNPETHEISFGTEGMKIDFGGIAKGYTSSEVMRLFSQSGVKSAVISLGGNVQTLGRKPDGSLWKVAINNPANDGSFLGILQTADKAVITSGGYERFFEENGQIWHHILDPATGYPADHGLLSVTIVSEDGTLADGLSTALFVQGLDKAMETWRRNADLFDFILFTEDQKLYISEGISEDFTSMNYPVQVVTKE